MIPTNSSLLHFLPKRSLSLFLLLFIFAVVTLPLIAANPGYFSHDEFQKLDHIQRHGFADYVSRYVRITSGETFGTPVRPLAFFIQGVLAFAMTDFPWIVHLAAIGMHVLAAFIFLKCIIALGGSFSLALLAATLFIVNPMTILATAWSAALMDRLYSIFGLLTLFASIHYVNNRAGRSSLVLIFAGSASAMLSKETAIILPGLLLILPLMDPRALVSRRFWLAAASWVAPVIAFLLIRLPAIIASFGEPSVTAYRASFSNVPEGLLVYAAYPFLPTLGEAQNWVFQSSWSILFALMIHGALVVLLWKLFSIKAMLAYCLYFIMFLVPVLLVPIKAAHYLYGSSLAVSLAIAAILLSSHRHSFEKQFAVIATVILVAHTIALQLFVYKLGSCMNRAYISTESVYNSNHYPEAIAFQALPGAPEHVLHRLFTGRNQIGESTTVTFTISPWGTKEIPDVLSVAMNSRCIVSTR